MLNKLLEKLKSKIIAKPGHMDKPPMPPIEDIPKEDLKPEPIPVDPPMPVPVPASEPIVKKRVSKSVKKSTKKK